MINTNFDYLNERPFFSIITPTHNRPDLLRRAIKSVLNQKFSNLEYIIVNDGSSANYNAIFDDELSLAYTYIESKKSQGVSCARNLGILEAKGAWIVFLDDDDELAPGYLHKLKEYIDNRIDSPAFIWSMVECIQYEKDGSVSGINTIDYSHFVEDKNQIFNSAIEIGASYGLAVDRQVFSKVGLFDCSFAVGEDTEFIVRLLSFLVEPHFLSVLGVIKHDHAYDRLSFNWENYSRLKVCEKIFYKHKNFILMNAPIYLRIFRRCAQLHYLSNNYECGDRAVRRIFLKSTFGIKSIGEYVGWKLMKWSIKFPLTESFTKKCLEFYVKVRGV